MAEKNQREVELEAELAEARASRAVAEGQLKAANTEIASLQQQLASQRTHVVEWKTQAELNASSYRECAEHMANLQVDLIDTRRKWRHAQAMIFESHKLLGRFVDELKGN
jgi:septation ring formation regulator EzrA